MVEKAIHGSSRNRLISSCRYPSLYIHPGSPPSIPRPLVILFPPSPSSSISCMFSHPAHSSHPFTIGLDKLNHHTADHVHMFYSLSLLRTFLISSILFTVYRLCCLLISHILSTVIPPIPSQSDTLPPLFGRSYFFVVILRRFPYPSQVSCTFFRQTHHTRSLFCFVGPPIHRSRPLLTLVNAHLGQCFFLCQSVPGFSSSQSPCCLCV